MSSNENRDAILKARAKQLSLIEQAPSSKSKAIEVVEFNISSETYALESIYIREVHPIRDYTPLPCAPAFIVGLISVRRKVLSLIDLCHFFDLPQTSEIIGKNVIVLEQGDMEFGILTDGMTKISLIPLCEIQPPLPTLTAIRQEFLKGITHDGRIILDAQKLFDNKQLIVNEVP